MGDSKFLPLVGALLFAAVCAYFFCGLFGVVDEVKTERAERFTVVESVRVDGIAVREEKLLSSSRVCSVFAQDGQRQPAGAVLAQSGGLSVSAPCSAVFLSGFDGLEYLSPKDCEALTVASLKTLTESVPAPVGSAFGRLVTDYVWYFAAFADAAVPEGERCAVAFDGFEGSVDGQLLSVSPQEDGKYAVLLRLTCGGDYLRLRRTSAELIVDSITGLALSPSAVRQDEQGEYVLTVNAGIAEKKPIEIVYRSRELCLAAEGSPAQGLTEGNIVIVYGESIEEGRVIA